MKIFSLITLSCLLLAGNIYSQNAHKSKLDSLFKILNDNNQAMGSIYISKDGQEYYKYSIGSSLINENKIVKSNSDTKYRIGSISKTFTAVMILQLVEENKLKLDNKLNEFFPEIPNAEKISISNLLNHRSGIFSITQDNSYTEWMTESINTKDMIEKIANYDSIFEPDSKAEYSNSNYILLGYIIEKVSGKSYSENLNERICNKIGLKDTYYGAKTNPDKNESYSYIFAEKWQQDNETDMSIPHGAGAIVSTPKDLTTFYTSLFQDKLLKESSLDKMIELKDGYGYGIVKIPFYDKYAYGHNGSIDAFISSAAYFPKENISIAYCSNGLRYPINDILIGVLSILFDKNYKYPNFKTITLSDTDIDKYTGLYSSKQIPLKINFTKNNNILFAEPTGQPKISLEASDVNKFEYRQAGAIFIFYPEKSELVLKQNGAEFLFTKEK